MKLIIATTKPLAPGDTRKVLSAFGAQHIKSTKVGIQFDVACEDDSVAPVIAAITRDGRIDAAVICASGNPSWIASLTRRACL